MACTSYTLSTLDAKCHTSIGGIKEILIAVKDDVESLSYADDTDKPGLGKVTGITMKSGAHFYRWSFRRNTGSFTSTVEKDATVGNQSVTTEVALQFSRAEATKRAEIQSAINADAIIIIHDMYDQWLVVGDENGVDVTNAVMQSGTANTDLSGFTMTFTAVGQYYPRFVKDKPEGEGDTDYIDPLSLLD